MRFPSLPVLCTALTIVCGGLHAADYDVVVYGDTASGVMAAVQAKRMGKTVVLVGPDKHLGGLSSGGLGFTDTGRKEVIGGLSREFYQRVWKHYQEPDAWVWQGKEEYGNKGQGTPAIDGDQRTMWIFEPHVAEAIFESYVKENHIPVDRDEWLDRAKGVKKDGARITSITMLSGKTYGGKMFIDATYEGDLMAAAGVDYHVGREAQSVYDEKWNGIQVGVLHHKHNFGAVKEPISAYVVPGDPKSGVLPRVSTAPPGEYGAGDKGVQAYCFRMCLTDRPENRIPFAKPEGYDPKQYELLARVYDAGWRETFEKFDPIPNHKTDTNNHGPFSTDDIGMNHDYPDASYERRKEIIKEHENYQKGWLYFIANDPRVPAEVREQMQRWGLPKDEFTDNGGWSHQLYIREARRMVGQYVMTENELLKKRPTPDSVGMGSYGIDSHNIQRYITPEGNVQNEGDIGVPLKAPYEIAYGSIVPKKGQADNLFAPVCMSASHIAYGSIRMEPVFMILGQSAATAAAMAIDAGVAVQDLPFAKLRERLIKDGQILETPAPVKAAAANPTPATEPGAQPPGYTIPTIDLSTETGRQVLVDREKGQYLGHPTTVLLEDGKTILTVYPKGHGRGGILYKRSTDGGLTWSERLPTPESWSTGREVPTIFRVTDAAGKKRLIVWSGLYPARLSTSEDDGATWSELKAAGKWGGIVVMGFVEPLKTGPGHYLAMFHDDGRFMTGKSTTEKPPMFTLYKTFSADGGLTWSQPEAVYHSSEVNLCEPGVVRSPDGKQLAVLLRENTRKKNSHIIFSNDEGKTWTEPRELPAALTGDRHTAKYTPDGRLFISFRDTTKKSPTKGDWVAWVGRYEDLVNGTEGQYRVRLMHNTSGVDCAYPGVEVLPDGTVVATTYGHWEKDEPPYIMSVRLKLAELDAKAVGK